MATYNKPLKAFAVATLMGLTAQAIDTADGQLDGVSAINAFMAHKTIKVKVTNTDVLIPFHAVRTATYATTSAESERTDPYCE